MSTIEKKQTDLRVIANNNYKKETFSMSALVRYAKGKGKKDVQAVIDSVNAKHGTRVTIGNINVKNIVKHATERELFTNVADDKVKDYVKGEPKTKFSFWLVLLTVGRLAKASK